MEHHAPKVRMQRVMETILNLIDEQEATGAIRKGQRDSEHSQRAISEASQRHRRALSTQLHDRLPPTHTARTRIADNPDAFDGIPEDEPQSLDCTGFILRQRYLVQEPGNFVIGRPIRTQRQTGNFGERLGFAYGAQVSWSRASSASDFARPVLRDRLRFRRWPDGDDRFAHAKDCLKCQWRLLIEGIRYQSKKTALLSLRQWFHVERQLVFCAYWPKCDRCGRNWLTPKKERGPGNRRPRRLVET